MCCTSAAQQHVAHGKHSTTETVVSPQTGSVTAQQKQKLHPDNISHLVHVTQQQRGARAVRCRLCDSSRGSRGSLASRSGTEGICFAHVSRQTCTRLRPDNQRTHNRSLWLAKAFECTHGSLWCCGGCASECTTKPRGSFSCFCARA